MHLFTFSFIEYVKDITSEEIIARANAQAWDSDTEEDHSIDKVEYNLEEKPGKYPVTFDTSLGTSVTVNINVVKPKIAEDADASIGIQAFDVYKSVDEIKESMAISFDLKTWADAYAWYLENEEVVDIDDVRFDFDPMEIVEGDYPVTFVTEGRQYKVHSTEMQEEGSIVSLDFGPEDIHVMHKMVSE